MTSLRFEGSALSRGGVRLLGAALHSVPSLRGLALDGLALRANDLTPLFTLLQGAATTAPNHASNTNHANGSAPNGNGEVASGGYARPPPSRPPASQCGLLHLSLRSNRLGDAGLRALVDALCVGGQRGACVLQSLDVTANSLSSGCIEDVCKLLGGLPSLLALYLLENSLGSALGGPSGLLSSGLRGVGGGGGMDALTGLLSSAAASALGRGGGGRAKDLLIAVLTNHTLCELHLDPSPPPRGLLPPRELVQLHQKLGKNREARSAALEHTELGADAPPTTPGGLGGSGSAAFGVGGSGGAGGRRLSQRVLSWGRSPRSGVGGVGGSGAGGLNGHGGAPSEVPVLGVLFSAPLVCTDPASGQVVPMDMLDFAKEKALICDSMREARRHLRVRFEHATTDRLRTLVTLGQCCGMHYSGHGDRSFLSMEDGRGSAHFVRVPALKKLLQAGSLASLRFVFVSACFSEAAAQAFVDAGVPHVIAVRLQTRVSDDAAHAFTRAFYLALAVGKSIREAFDIGVQAVVTSPTVRAGEVEGDKFLLLGNNGHHDEVPFRLLARVDSWAPPVPPAAAHQQPLPANAECFVGRNVETYRVVTGVLDRRLLSVIGEPGVGKSAVAIAATNYLCERHYFSDGVIFVDCHHVASPRALAALLRHHVALGTNAAVRPSWERSGEGGGGGEAAGGGGGEGGGGGGNANGGENGGMEGGGGIGDRAGDLELLRAAVAPLQGLHTLLVLDGLSVELVHGKGGAPSLGRSRTPSRDSAASPSPRPFTPPPPPPPPAEAGANAAGAAPPQEPDTPQAPPQAPSTAVPEFLSLLLSFARVRTLLTTVHPVAQPLQGGAEKVVGIRPLSSLHTAKLLCKLSPRPLLLSEIEGAGSAQEFVQRLAQHQGIMQGFRGNPGLVKAAAPRLSHARLVDIHEDLASATAAHDLQASRDGSRATSSAPSPLPSPRASPMPA